MAKRLLMTAILAGLILAPLGPARAEDKSPKVAESASADNQTLVPNTFYPGLKFEANPLKAKVDLKKPAVLDPSPIKKDSPEELIIKRALSRDKAAPKTQATPAAKKKDDKKSGLVDVDLGPGAEFTMGYRYLDYGKLDDAGIPFNNDEALPKADYYGKPANGQEQLAHELSIGVKVDLQ